MTTSELLTGRLKRFCEDDRFCTSFIVIFHINFRSNVTIIYIISMCVYNVSLN